MSSSWKSVFSWIAGGFATGVAAHWLFGRYAKRGLTGLQNEVMEVIFTNDRTEAEATQGINYLELSNLKDFSPRNLTRIKEAINSAKSTIDAAVYLFNVKELGDAMIRAHERGVTVRILGCKSMAGATGTQFPDMLNVGEY